MQLLCLIAAYVFKWGIAGVYMLLTTEEIFRLIVSLVILKKKMDDQFIIAESDG